MAQQANTANTVLFLDHSQALGGAEYSLLLLLQHLDRTRWQPQLACPAGALASAAQQLGITWHNVPLPRLRRSPLALWDWFQSAASVARIARQSGAKVVVTNTVRATFYGALASKLGQRPFVWYMRDFWLGEGQPRYPQLDTFLKRVICRRATAVIANSAATAQHLPCSNVTVVPNGIDLSRFPPNTDGTSFRQTHNIPPNAPLVGTVGRLRPWKGHHHFIEMAAILATSQPETHFVIVGGQPFGEAGDYLHRLHQLAEEKGLEKKLHFTGHLDDPTHALAAMDVFVHCGDPEPFGLVNIEAMATGKPVVAFSHGALPEIIKQEKTGLLVPPYNIEALAEAVGQLLQAPQRRKTLGQAGRQRVADHFTIQQTAVHVSNILKKTVEGTQ